MPIMPTRRTLLLCLSLLMICGWSGQPAKAQNGDLPTRASQFVDALGKSAVAVMATKDINKSQRIERFRTMLRANFDIPTIARFVLGRYWNIATPEQQQDYFKVFEEMVVRSYASRFDTYSGETFHITSSRPEGERDAFVVTEILRPNGPPVNVEWRVRQRETLGIIDIVVEGVSMSVTQRQEFATVIQSKGGDIGAFLKALSDKNAAMAASQ